MISLDVVKRLNPGAGASLRRMFENMDLRDLQASIGLDDSEVAHSQPARLPNPLAHLEESTGGVGARDFDFFGGGIDEAEAEAEVDAEAEAEVDAGDDSDSDQRTVSEDNNDGNDNDDRDEILMPCDTYIAPAAATGVSLWANVSLPLCGASSRIRYRKNFAKAGVLLARLIGTPLLRGHFYILVEENGGAATHRFLRVYGELTSEERVGKFVLPRQVVRIIERDLDMMPKESVTFTAAAAGIDPGPGYKFNTSPGLFALTVTKV